jgi:membrane protein
LADAPGRRRLGDHVKYAFDVLKEALLFFRADRARRLSAGLAYYTLFALIPSLLFAVAVAAAFVGKEAAAGGLEEQLTNVLGPEAAAQIEEAIATVWENTDSSGFALFSVGIVLYSASILFVAWRDSVELIWEVPFEPGLHVTLRSRAFAMLVPVIAGLLLAGTMIMQSLVTFVQGIFDGELIDAAVRTLSAAAQVVFGLAALSVLYRYSARKRRPDWRDILPASIFVGVVLGIGYWAYGLYLRAVGVNSVTGAAAGVVLGLVVIYYSSQVLLLGAEIIKVLDARRKDPDGAAGADKQEAVDLTSEP